MAKNAFATIGILAVLLLSLGIVSADIENFDLYIDGAGSSSTTPLIGDSSSTPNFNVTLTNDNTSLTLAYVSWRVATTTTMTVPANDSFANTVGVDHTISGFILSMPDKAPSRVNLYADVYTNLEHTTLYGTEQVSVYFDNTDYIAPAEDPTIATTLDSEAKVGKELIITASITNNNADIDSFEVSVSDYNSWATFTSITSQPISIDADVTEEVTIKFTPTLEGEQTFNINVEVDDETYDQAIIVNVLPEDEDPEDTLCGLEFSGEQGDLEISDFDIEVTGEGNDEEWQYLDKIEIIVEIENTNKNDYDVDDVEVKIVIMDGKIENGGKDVTGDFDLDEETLEGIGTLKDGKKEEVTFRIDELSSELDSGTYYMYIMAYEDNNEAEQCESKESRLGDSDYYFEFEIESVNSDEAIVAKNLGLNTVIDAYCGQQNLKISIPIYNLGDDDDDGERVLVILSDSELGIYEPSVIRNLDSGDRKDVVFFIDIPSELSKEKYDLDISVYFDWDEDEDEDEITSYDEQTSDTSLRLNIESCQGPTPTISASLNSDANLGEELVITATIINNGEDDNFDITVTGYESWAELISISPQSLSLDEDEEGTVTITLIPNKGGVQTFDVNAEFGDESHPQAVSVNIAGEDKKGLFADVSKTVIYSFAGIAALIILIFLTLIVKVSRRAKKVPQF